MESEVKNLHVPIKAIIGSNDGMLSISAVKQLYSDKIKLEVWDNLPHLLNSEVLALKVDEYILSYFES